MRPSFKRLLIVLGVISSYSWIILSLLTIPEVQASIEKSIRFLNITYGNTSNPNLYESLDVNVTYAPTSQADGTIAIISGKGTYTGGVDIVNPGHMIGTFGWLESNAPGRTVDLLIGAEGKINNTDGNLTNGVGTLGVLTANGPGDTITSWIGNLSQITANTGTITTAYGNRFVLVANAGTISTLYGYYFPDLSAFSGITNKWGFVNLDASAKSRNASEFQLGTAGDVGIKRAAASVLDVTDGSGTLAYMRRAGHKYVGTQFNAVGTTALANVTDLSVTVIAGRTYKFEADLHVAADATGGHKYAIAGNATATLIVYQINSINNATNAIRISARHSALGGNTGEALGTAYNTKISGAILVNAGGTLTVQFAQNTGTGTSSVLLGSTWTVEDITP